MSISTTCYRAALQLRTLWPRGSWKKSSPTTASSNTLVFYLGQLRRCYAVCWAAITCYGLYGLLDFTGFALARGYVLRAVYPTRWRHTGAVTLPHATQSTSTLAVELPAIGRQPLIGVRLRCWVSAWCVGLAQPGGEMGWVFRDEVSASAYAALRRRVLHGV